MRLKSWVMTVAVTAVAAAALGVVVAANDPVAAPAQVRVLFWAALAIGVWGAAATLLLAVRMRLVQAVWAGSALTAGLLASAALRQQGMLGQRLLAGIVFATLSLIILFWYRFRARD